MTFNIKESTEKFKTDMGLLLDLVSNDLKSRYSGSAFGVAWAFVQPLVTILVFWYVFQMGFKNPPVDNVAYILWFIAGYIPWSFFNDAVMSSANVFYEYTFLVKKMKFQIWQLPIVKVLSSLYIHFYFIGFIIGMYLLYGSEFHFAWLSVFYYSFCLAVIVIGIAFLVSSVSVFIKDATQLVGIVLQIGFWLTPVFWSSNSMRDGILKFMKLNPLYYIIEGYRSALVDNVGFISFAPDMRMYFWGVAILILVAGAYSFRTLKVHFADLL